VLPPLFDFRVILANEAKCSSFTAVPFLPYPIQISDSVLSLLFLRPNPSISNYIRLKKLIKRSIVIPSEAKRSRDSTGRGRGARAESPEPAESPELAEWVERGANLTSTQDVHPETLNESERIQVYPTISG
jgi:hypothetical protein